ncbi:hypothetical protein JZU71_00055, partial [bacterium]|nr:hypothetical protein [bacterium]
MSAKIKETFEPEPEPVAAGYVPVSIEKTEPQDTQVVVDQVVSDAVELPIVDFEALMAQLQGIKDVQTTLPAAEKKNP